MEKVADLIVSKHMNVRCYKCTINDDYVKQNKCIRQGGSHVVVGTLEDIYGILTRDALLAKGIKLCVLDEVKEMLLGGFKNQIRNVFKLLPKKVKVMFVLAKWPDEVTTLSSLVERDPIHIHVEVDISVPYQWTRKILGEDETR